jgi:hypothetical protein
MKRRSFLGSLIGGVGALLIPKSDNTEQYFKSEIIDRSNDNVPACSGTLFMHIVPQDISGSGCYLQYDREDLI